MKYAHCRTCVLVVVLTPRSEYPPPHTKMVSSNPFVLYSPTKYSVSELDVELRRQGLRNGASTGDSVLHFFSRIQRPKLSLVNRRTGRWESVKPPWVVYVCLPVPQRTAHSHRSHRIASRSTELVASALRLLLFHARSNWNTATTEFQGMVCPQHAISCRASRRFGYTGIRAISS